MKGFLPALSALLLLGACHTPGATQLAHQSRSQGGPRDLEQAAGPAQNLPVQPLELRGVRGGVIALTLPGSASEVLAMLLDLDHAAGHRAWARSYRILERSATRVHSEWSFEGRMGINPTVQLELTVQSSQPPLVLNFKLVKPTFGLAAFFGDYRITTLPAEPPRCLLEERVFIDSGIFLANASEQDIRDGLREDARLMRAWMHERLQR